MKYKLAKVAPEYYDEALIEVDIFAPIRVLPRKIKGFIFNQINKINHPRICNLINRHIMPKSISPYGLDILSPRKCLRCGETRSVNMVISPSLWSALNIEADSWIALAKTNIFPVGMKSAYV